MMIRRLLILAALVAIGAAAAYGADGIGVPLAFPRVLDPYAAAVTEPAVGPVTEPVTEPAPRPVTEPVGNPPVGVVETPLAPPAPVPEPIPPVHQRDVLRGRLAEAAADDASDWHGRRTDRLSGPLPGARVPTVAGQLPGAPRAYRNGYHEGVDFYDGYAGLAIAYGDPVRSAGSGIVTRADGSFSELSASARSELLARATAAADTSDDDLDLLHGRQVWIDHGDGVVTRYSHLAVVTVSAGDEIQAGDIIGEIGNSGTSDGVRGSTAGAHLHFEIYLDRRPFWDGLTLDQIRTILTAICALP